MFKITQKVKLEYGRFSALPHHLPTRIVETTQFYFSIERYALRGSAFQSRDPETNLPPLPDRFDFSERCYVTFGEYEIEKIME